MILFTDSIYAIATAKTNCCEGGRRRLCEGCKVLEVADTPIGDLSNRMGQLTTSLLVEVRQEVDLLDRRQRPLLSTSRRPSLQAAGVDPANGYPRQISAGDGSVPAFKRIRDKQYQIATVAEPLNLQGWIMIDEMNRAFAGEKPSGFVPHVHLFTADNIDKDGGTGEQVRSRQRLSRRIQEDLGREVAAQIGHAAMRGDASCVARPRLAIRAPHRAERGLVPAMITTRRPTMSR